MKNFSRPFARVALSLAALLLSSCVGIPKLGDAPELKDTSAYETAKSFSSSKAEWPNENWWTSYNDPQLNTLVTEALQNAPSLASAKARLDRAEAQARQAGSALLPELAANASVSKTKQSYNNGVPANFVPHGYNDTGRATLDFSYEIDFWGRNRAALAAATSEANAVRAESDQAKLMLTTSIVAAYADLAQLYADRQALQEALDVRTHTAKLFKERMDNGLETLGGSKQAEAAQAAAKAALLATEENIALTKNRIAALMGLGPDRGLSITAPTINLALSDSLPENLPVDLIARRPDIVAAKLHASARTDAIKVAKTEFYPNVNLTALIGVQSLGLDYLTKSGSDIGSIGPAIHLPIFEGGRLDAQYRSARAEYDSAVATYNDTVTQALREVADAVTSRKALEERLSVTKQALDASREAYRVSKNRYEGGIATYLSVLTAEDAMIDARRAMANLQSRIFVLDVALVRALGGGFTQNTKVTHE